MKKMIILTGLLVTMLTGCGNTEAEVNEVENESTTTTVYDEAIETSEELVDEVYDYLYLTEEELEVLKNDTIDEIKTCGIEDGMSEECIEETIKLIESVEHDPTFMYGYDHESLCKDYLRILDKYELIPEEYSNYTIDEIYNDAFA